MGLTPQEVFKWSNIRTCFVKKILKQFLTRKKIVKKWSFMVQFFSFTVAFGFQITKIRPHINLIEKSVSKKYSNKNCLTSIWSWKSKLFSFLVVLFLKENIGLFEAYFFRHWIKMTESCWYKLNFKSCFAGKKPIEKLYILWTQPKCEW